MTRSKQYIDADHVGQAVAQLEALAKDASSRAQELAGHTAQWAGPHVEAARDWLEPRIDRAWRRGVQAAAPKVSQAAAAVATGADTLHEALVTKVVPSVVETVNQAASAAAEPVVAVVAAPKKHRLRKVLLWLGLTGAAAGIGYLLYRQTRPLDDPWAEDAWAAEKDGWELDELIDEGANAPKNLSESVQEGAEKLADAVKDVKDDLTDAAGDAAEAVGQAAGATVKKVQDVAKKTTRRVSKKAKDVADEVEEATEE